MNKKIASILAELKQFISGKTIDAIIPPLSYIITNSLLGVKKGLIISLAIAFILAIYRIFKREKIIYSLGGIGAVVLAAGFVVVSKNPASYFVPKILGSGFLALICILSIFLGKPLAAILSHISRGWDFKWFLRDDIKPAYTEVTFVWAGLFLLRMILQVVLYKRGNVTELGWASIVLGFPATLLILILTLIYGLWRLKKLGGPGIDEYEKGQEPPWQGQKKGF